MVEAGKVDREWVLQTLQALVRTDSVNPSLVPGARGEAEIAVLVARQLREIGLAVETFEPEPGRVSVVGTLKGAGCGPSLMLNAHLDTVGVAGMPDPFSGELRSGRVYGRGAYDMKGSLAACIAAARELTTTPLQGDLIVAAVADEEYGSLGTTDLISRLPKIDAAIVTEPTTLEICLAHKGYLWMEVAVTGRAAHGSKFESGIDANLKMGRFLHALEALEKDLRVRNPHPLVGPPSLHAALLEGGTGLSTYAAISKVQIERRTVPGETEAQAVAEIQAILDRLSASDPDFHAAVRCYFARDPFEVTPNAQIVKSLHNAATHVRGQPPRYVGDTPWMDAALLSAAGIETVVCGPAGAGAHASEEWVDLDSVVTLAEMLAVTARLFCGLAAATHPSTG
jgi:acetylornithine deacetylase